jgi:hypothetical protein
MPQFTIVQADHVKRAQDQKFVPLTTAQLIALAIKIAKG